MYFVLISIFETYLAVKIGIVNAGNLGLHLAIPWIRRGHDIMLSKDAPLEPLQERFRNFRLQQGLPRVKYLSLNSVQWRRLRGSAKLL